MEKLLQLAKKLNELAKRGIDGEKANAEAMLYKLIKKHNLRIEDIEGEKTADYFFKLSQKDDEQLFCQITHHVNPDIKIYGCLPVKYVKELGLKGNYMITCTASEYLEIDAKFSIYSKLYKQELDIFYEAFCTANNILIHSKNPERVSDFDEREMENFLRMRRMARNIETRQYHKGLNGKKP